MTKHLQRLVITPLLLVPTITSFAETVALDEARAIATEFVSTRSNNQSRNAKLELAYTACSKAKPLYYVFNAADNSGFIIISAEDSTTPILAYSFEGAYPINSLPDAMKWVMDGMEQELLVAPTIQDSRNTTERKQMARSAAMADEVQKLLPTPDWSQEAPFNSMIPGRPLVGCVGTAMATIMKYHQWPKTGTGSFDGVDFNVNYNWTAMRTDNYRKGYSQAESDAVATLMYHASKSIDTQYAMSGSSAYEVRVPSALSTYFGYDPGVSYKKRSEVSSQDVWNQIVIDEINAGRPVLYCGQDVTAGHAFVCDGYQGNYLHINWGWGGAANGYFLSTALNPTVSRNHNYNNLNTIIYNIKPATGTVSAWSPIHITADGNQPGIGSDMTDLSSNKKFTVRVGNLKNLSYSDFSGKIAVGLCSSTGKMKALLSSPASFSLQSMATLANGYIDLHNCILGTGTDIDASDRIRIMTQANGQTEWLPVAGELPTVNELNTKIPIPASFQIKLPTGVTGVTIKGEKSVIRGWNYSFTVVPTNPKDDVITVKANGYVLTPTDNNVYTVANVREDQIINVIVQKASEVKEKRSIWVSEPGSLSSLISDEESGTIKELNLFGTIDARDFSFMKNSMRLTRLDLSGVRITANGSDQANAIPREAFRGIGSLTEVVLPTSINRLNNGCFRQCGITTITIPAGVKTYEYNVFVGAYRLRDIYVGRETAEFINWCVLSGVNTKALTLHVPNERAVTNYSNAENWKTIGNIIVDPIKDKTECLFAVMDNAAVKFDSDHQSGNVAKGTKIGFTARHIAENDNRMEVYANASLLTPDATGTYHTTVTENTIIHFNLITPTEVSPHNSPWTLTAKNGSIGMFTDAVNVIPGQDFTIRVNALNVPSDYDQMFWAAVLTDATGNIKEFISPVTIWTGGTGDGIKMNVNCCVKESTVREGNTIRLVTSASKKIWSIVKGADDSITDALPALNNMTPVYNINIPSVPEATITGAVATAVRGRDINLKIVPKSSANRIDMTVNGEKVITAAVSVNYTFIAMSDMNFDIKVYDPKETGSVTYNVTPGSLYKAVTAASVCANVIVTGETYASDLRNAFTQVFAQKTVKRLDLSGLKIIADPTNGAYTANMMPADMFYNSSAIGQTVPVLEDIQMPASVVRIADAAFNKCANLKEITIPDSLSPVRMEIGKYASGSIKYGYGIGNKAFQGCTSLTTIYIPGPIGRYNNRDVVSHHNPRSTTMESSYEYNNLGFEHPEKVTVVVPEKYLSVYRTPYADTNYGNPWEAHGYNILSEYPVYGVNFDPTRIRLTDEKFDVTKAASFLGDNVSLNSITVSDKLMLVNPETACRVYDNGKLITPSANGSIAVEFLNPAKNSTGTGNHELTVIYTYNLTFNSTSPLFTISNPEVTNNGGYKFETFDSSNAQTPVLKDVAENSTVRFRVNFASEHSNEFEIHVMSGQQQLIADSEGLYSVDINNASKTLEIFAVPGNGATLTEAELAAINPSESAAITSIALAGNISPESLAKALKNFPSLENLDLSDLSSSLPDGAFAGMTNLTTVVMPQIESIGANMFNGCTSLRSIDIPASVNTIGDNAFKNCKSLETIRLTSIGSIGTGAFSGCDNLTTITLLAGNGSESGNVTKTSRIGSITTKAFDGLNPNCIVIIDEGVPTPETGVNYIVTSTGTITETQPDGTIVNREGRIYTAPENICLRYGHPLALPHTFTLGKGASISLEAEYKAKTWSGITVPFDVQNIKNMANQTVEITVVTNGKAKSGCALVYTLIPNGEKLQSVGSLNANTPAMIRTPEGGKVMFMASNGAKIPATPADTRIDGKNFSLNATYTSRTVPATETYVLNEDASAFKPAGAVEESVTLNPFDVYATSRAAIPEIVTGLPGDDITTGIDETLTDFTELTVIREGSSLIIYSPDNRTLTLYATDGRAVRVISLTTGRNLIEIPIPGVYVIANRKIIF